MKYLKIMLILVMVVAAAGCIDGNDTTDDTPQYSLDYSTSNDTSTNNDEQATNQPNTSTTRYDASGYCPYVVDGDTLDVEGVGRIRFVGVNTPERGESGYQQAKDYIKQMCLGKTVQLDIDDAKKHDRYGRVLAVVYVNNVNLNAELLKRGYAEVMYIPPSEFNPYSWT